MRNAALSLLLAAALSSCAVHPPAGTYVGGSTMGSITKIPSGWRTFSAPTVIAAQMPQANSKVPGWLKVQGFSAGPDAKSLFTATDTPTGWLLIREVRAGEDADALIRDAVFPYTQGISGGSIVLTGTPMAFQLDGHSGEALAYDVSTASGVVRVLLKGVRAGSPQRVHVLAVGCTVACQNRYAGDIQEIFTNWRVVRP